jgi:hypothetical protein
VLSDPVRSSRGTITGYFTGWGAEAVRITISGATYSEVPTCSPGDGYMTTDAESGFKSHSSALLAAYMSGKTVNVVVDGCVSGRPKIVGVEIY